MSAQPGRLACVSLRSPEPFPLAALRTEVARFRAGERRPRFPLAVHLGTPDGDRVTHQTLPGDGDYDAALRTEVVGALLDLSGRSAAWVWLTRPGVPQVHDQDLAWLSASRAAFAERGATLHGFLAVTRTGWLDPVGGAARVWKRPRLRQQGR